MVTGLAVASLAVSLYAILHIAPTGYFHTAQVNLRRGLLAKNTCWAALEGRLNRSAKRYSDLSWKPNRESCHCRRRRNLAGTSKARHESHSALTCVAVCTRNGSSPEQIASALEVPRQEVDLLLKVHEMVLNNL